MAQYRVKLGTFSLKIFGKRRSDRMINHYLRPYKVCGRFTGPDMEHPITKNQNWWDASGRWLASRELLDNIRSASR